MGCPRTTAHKPSDHKPTCKNVLSRRISRRFILFESLCARKLSTGCLWGCAVGDAIGLPYEGLIARRARRLARLPLKHRFVFGRGMISDDTDHTVFVAQALIRSKGDPARFQTVLAWRLRLWLLCLPAGIGLATLRGIVRLWLGLRPSGVFSAGNGPATRQRGARTPRRRPYSRTRTRWR